MAEAQVPKTPCGRDECRHLRQLLAQSCPLTDLDKAQSEIKRLRAAIHAVDVWRNTPGTDFEHSTRFIEDVGPLIDACTTSTPEVSDAEPR